MTAKPAPIVLTQAAKAQPGTRVTVWINPSGRRGRRIAVPVDVVAHPPAPGTMRVTAEGSPR